MKMRFSPGKMTPLKSADNTEIGPRRILVFAPHFAEYAMRLASALSERAEVCLICEARNHRAECDGLSIGDGARQLAVATYRSDFALRTWSLTGYIERWRVRRAIRAFAPDLVHLQEQGDAFTATIASEMARHNPLVVTVHDPAPHSGNDALVATQFADGLRRIRAAAHAFHVHGAYCEAALRERLAQPKPIAATAHGVILVSLSGRRYEGDRYLFFGRMEAYKGLDILLDAIDALPTNHRRKFILAGRGPELDRLRERIAAMPAVEVIDKFLLPTEAVAQFQRARAVIVPYRDATQSGVISAAVGNGVPVIASRVGGLVDAVGDQASDDTTCGLLVAAGDPRALAAALMEMDQDAVQRRLTKSTRVAATERFAWTTIVARLHALYAELLADRRRADQQVAVKD